MALPVTFATLPAGYSPLSKLDVNFTYLNQRIDAVSVTSENLTGTSNTTNSISTGEKVFHVNELLRAWLPGAFIIVSAEDDPGNQYLIGTVSDYSDNILTLEVTVAVGGGSFTSWALNLTGAPASGVPDGGSDGQALVKLSSGSGDVGWDDRVKGPTGAIEGNLPAFGDGSGNLLADSGSKPADFATAGQGSLAETALQAAANLADVADAAEALTNLGGFPATAGVPLTGQLGIQTDSTPQLSLLKSGTGHSAEMIGYTGVSPRWALYLGDAAAEGGGNAGSNFGLYAYSDAGSLLGAALTVARATRLASVAGDPTTALGIATKQYVDAVLAQLLGVGQTWQDLTASRASGTIYQNTTGKPIQLRVTFSNGTGAFLKEGPASPPTIVVGQSVSSADNQCYPVIPNGDYYEVTGGQIVSWFELR